MKTALVRLVIAITLVRLLGNQAPTQAVKLLVDTLVVAGSEESKLAKKYAELPCADEAVAGEIAGSLCQLEPKLAAEIAVPALCTALHTTDGFTALTLISALVYLTFRQPLTEADDSKTAQEKIQAIKGQKMATVNYKWEDLNEPQKQVLVALAESPNAWQFNGNLASLFRNYHLPTDLSAMQAFVQATSI